MIATPQSLDFVSSPRYKLEEVIGHGAFGVVWYVGYNSCVTPNYPGSSATDLHTMKKVAIKRGMSWRRNSLLTRKVNLFRTHRTRKQALREIKLLKLFKHPNLLHLVEVELPSNQTSFTDWYFTRREFQNSNKFSD
eukprot:TRINITY_DN5332_c0_g2_i1.p1 TRINITY_DN5332_c0_g2~~TRINITY_DN5332_c0_g2_i1.p1  ORF type:complete len:152 (-),score=23.00 TRINITY_DN5332_c0_g2_i1:693-1100(-)